MDINLSDAERSFQDAIRNAGLTPPDRIIFDGRIHRFDSDDKRDQSGWYVAFSDEHPAGEFGCWRKGFQETWRYYRGQDLSGAERAKMALARKRAKEARQEEQEKIYQEAAPGRTHRQAGARVRRSTEETAGIAPARGNASWSTRRLVNVGKKFTPAACRRQRRYRGFRRKIYDSIYMSCKQN